MSMTPITGEKPLSHTEAAAIPYMALSYYVTEIVRLRALLVDLISNAEPISNLDGLGASIIEGPVISALSESVRKAKEGIK